MLFFSQSNAVPISYAKFTHNRKHFEHTIAAQKLYHCVIPDDLQPACRTRQVLYGSAGLPCAEKRSISCEIRTIRIRTRIRIKTRTRISRHRTSVSRMHRIAISRTHRIRTARTSARTNCPARSHCTHSGVIRSDDTAMFCCYSFSFRYCSQNASVRNLSLCSK